MHLEETFSKLRGQIASIEKVRLKNFSRVQRKLSFLIMAHNFLLRLGISY